MYEIDIYGKDGTRGGDGGDGGRNGYRGKSGEIELITLGNFLGISSIKNNGSDGTMGKGGEGGAGGLQGYTFYLEFLRQYAFGVRVKDNFGKFERREDREYGLPGSRGRDGANGAKIPNPEPAASIHNKAEIISHYKSYVIQNLDDEVGGRIRRNDLMKFIRELDANIDIKRVFNESGLSGE
jgi:hypothetical protein